MRPQIGAPVQTVPKMNDLIELILLLQILLMMILTLISIPVVALIHLMKRQIVPMSSMAMAIYRMGGQSVVVVALRGHWLRR